MINIFHEYDDRQQIYTVVFAHSSLDEAGAWLERTEAGTAAVGEVVLGGHLGAPGQAGGQVHQLI